MRQTRKPSVFLLLLLVSVLFASPAFTQVIAGIRANGQVINHGDTVRICEGNAVNYQSAGQGSMTISWRFTGGSQTTAAGLGPIVVNYPKAGYYTATQEITGGNMSDSMFIVVHVSNNMPTASYSFTPNSVCGNINIQFTDHSTGTGLSYYWDFGDGSISTAPNPAHQFLNAVGMPGTTTYPVKLVVTNLFGCKDSTTQTVIIKNVPDASVGNADAAISFGTFNGVPTFRRCSNIASYTYSFINQSTTTPINTSYAISWGDGTPDTTFNTWPAGIIIKHIFPLGSNTMTVSVTGSDGCIGIKNTLSSLVLPRQADYRAWAIPTSVHPTRCGLPSIIFRPIHRVRNTLFLLMMVHSHRYLSIPHLLLPRITFHKGPALLPAAAVTILSTMHLVPTLLLRTPAELPAHL